MDYQSYLFLFSITFHLFLSFLYCYLFPNYLSIQKYFLGKDYENIEVLSVMKLLFFNYGAYHGLLSMIGMIGQFIESYHLTQGVLVIFLSHGFSYLWNNSTKYSLLIALLQIIPAAIALYLPSHLQSHQEDTIDFPVIPVLIPAVLHIVFFIVESVLFSKVSIIQKIFLGKSSKTKEAVKYASEYFFDQGLYNLKLALLTLYGLYIVKSPAIVISTLFVYFAAGVVLIYSSPRLWKGFVVQSLPALYALYLLADHAEIIYYELLRSIYTEDDEDH